MHVTSNITYRRSQKIFTLGHRHRHNRRRHTTSHAVTRRRHDVNRHVPTMTPTKFKSVFGPLKNQRTFYTKIGPQDTMKVTHPYSLYVSASNGTKPIRITLRSCPPCWQRNADCPLRDHVPMGMEIYHTDITGSFKAKAWCFSPRAQRDLSTQKAKSPCYRTRKKELYSTKTDTNFEYRTTTTTTHPPTSLATAYRI